MKKVQVVAQVPEKKDKEGKITQKALGPATVEVDYGETAEESIKMFGDEPMNSNAFANWRVTLQSNIRSNLKAGLDLKAIQTKLGQAKMGVAQAGVKIDPVQAYIARFASETPEGQQKMLAELKNRAAEAGKK